MLQRADPAPGRRGRCADAGAASNHSAFNIANALGAWLGGLVISWGYGYGATGFVGAALSALRLAVFLVSILIEKRASGR